jgi:hypothetical protein
MTISHAVELDRELNSLEILIEQIGETVGWTLPYTLSPVIHMV